jgi:hypothetical protein
VLEFWFALLCYYITRIDEYDLYTQIALVLSLILLENLMHVKDAQISKFVPLLLKDLTLVTPSLDTGYCFLFIIYSMFCFDEFACTMSNNRASRFPIR